MNWTPLRGGYIRKWGQTNGLSFFREVRERGRKEIGEGVNMKGGENKESRESKKQGLKGIAYLLNRGSPNRNDT